MRIARLFSLSLAVFCSLATAARAEWPTIATEAKQAIMVDYQTGAVLLAKNADELMPPSSMSKLMTAYMVFDKLKKGELKLDDELPVSEKAWRTGGSKMFVQVGSRVKIEDLLRGMIVQSGNDACVTLAEGLAGSEERFAETMTEKARSLGMAKSVFRNASGLPDPQHVMTARELSILARRIIADFPQFYGYYSEINFTYNGIKQGNRNPLLYKNVGADGMKTGHTDAAGYGLTASAVRDGRRLVLVINGMTNVNQRSREAERLLDWGFREFDTVVVAKAGQPIEQADVWLGQAPKVGLASDTDIAVTLPRPARKTLAVSLKYDGPVPAPVRAGQPLGRLSVSADRVEARDYPLVAANAVERLGLPDRIFAAGNYLIFGKQTR